MTVTQRFKKLLWYIIANSTIEDAKNAMLNDEVFLRDVKNCRNATIHLSKKHLGIVVAKVVNYWLSDE